MLLYKRLAIYFRKISKGFPPGMSLMELLVATALGGILVYASHSIYENMQNDSLNSDRRQAALSETSEFLTSLKESWDIRQRPFTPTNKGFVLHNSGGAPCTTNCPRLDIFVTRNSGAVDTISFQSTCQNVASAQSYSILTRLNQNFNSALTGGCNTCGAGMIPVVTFTQNIPSKARRYPHNGEGSMATYSVNGILGFSACFTQTGTGPIQIVVNSITLPDSTSGTMLSRGDVTIGSVRLKSMTRSLILPFDNFANVQVDSKL